MFFRFDSIFIKNELNKRELISEQVHIYV